MVNAEQTFQKKVERSVNFLQHKTRVHDVLQAMDFVAVSLKTEVSSIFSVKTARKRKLRSTSAEFQTSFT